MSRKNRKPAWWQLFMLAPMMFVLMAVEHLAPLPGVSDGVVDIGIVILTFAAMLGWVHLNGGALEWYEIDKESSLDDLEITVYEPAAKAMQNRASSHESPSWRIPHSPVHARGQESVQLEEEDKWFLN